MLNVQRYPINNGSNLFKSTVPLIGISGFGLFLHLETEQKLLLFSVLFAAG